MSAPRFVGTLTAWNDDRGFGFLRAAEGGEDIFVHATAFAARQARPQVGTRVSFEIEPGPRGKKRARNVALLRNAPAPRRRQPASAAPWTATTALAIPVFMAVLLAVAWRWRPPFMLPALAVYAVTSTAAFIAYALDKSKAQRGEWRTPENTLHLLALAGGWPGALLAQQLMRHKSSKPSFRAVFWCTVLLNVAGFVALCSPEGRAWLAQA